MIPAVSHRPLTVRYLVSSATLPAGMSGDTVNFPANDTQSSGLLQVQNTLTAFINKVATQLRHRGGHLAETKHKITAPTELNKVATQPTSGLRQNTK